MTLPKFRNFVARTILSGFDAVQRTRMSGFDAASRSITRIKNWVPSNTEINTLIVADGNLMRARSRKLARENPWARGAIDSFVSNCVGTGIVPRFKHPNKKMRARMKAAWDRWVLEADANGMSDFYGLQGTAVRAIRTDGEVFTRLRFRRPTDALHVPFQIQLVEADHVPYWKTDDQAQYYTRAGIQFNLLGQRELYWMYRDHPGSAWVKDAQLYPIPADSVLHCFDVLRPGQIRGEIWLSAAIVMLYDIKQLLDAALLRQKVVNLLSVWIKRGQGAGSVLGETDNKNGSGTAALTPGSVNYLDGNEEVNFLTPPEAGIQFKEFLNSMLRAVARAMGITFEQLTGDLTGVNYSSIRAGLLEFRRWCEAFQHGVVVHQFCRPVMDAWMQQAILVGVLGPRAAVEYQAHPEYYTADWTPPGWAWVNPKEDVEAFKVAVRAGFTSRARVVAENGESVEDIDRDQADDNARADESGLKYDSDGRNPMTGPTVSENSTSAPPAGSQDPAAGPPDTSNGDTSNNIDTAGG